jgi:hypothetical protein
VDGGTFAQILEMDDDEDGGDFSKSIVDDFFEQAVQTFEKMDRALWVCLNYFVFGCLFMPRTTTANALPIEKTRTSKSSEILAISSRAPLQLLVW